MWLRRGIEKSGSPVGSCRTSPGAVRWQIADQMGMVPQRGRKADTLQPSGLRGKRAFLFVQCRTGANQNQVPPDTVSADCKSRAGDASLLARRHGAGSGWDGWCSISCCPSPSSSASSLPSGRAIRLRPRAAIGLKPPHPRADPSRPKINQLTWLRGEKMPDILSGWRPARRTAQRGGGTLAQSHALGPAPDGASVLRFGQPAHALGAQ